MKLHTDVVLITYSYIGVYTLDKRNHDLSLYVTLRFIVTLKFTMPCVFIKAYY
jgi:hypothetical protein